MTKRVVKEDGTVEIIQENKQEGKQQQQGQGQGQGQGQQQAPPQPQAQGQGQEGQQQQQQEQPLQGRIDPETLVQRDPSQNITHFKKLEAAGDEAERNIKFDTEEKLKKYNESVRIINNLNVEDPFRYQQEHGIFPKRGNLDIGKRGLTPQDMRDIIAGKKTLEVADEQKKTYRAV